MQLLGGSTAGLSRVEATCHSGCGRTHAVITILSQRDLCACYTVVVSYAPWFQVLSCGILLGQSDSVKYLSEEQVWIAPADVTVTVLVQLPA